MPFRDGTGPAGTGPMTGRGAGNCTGFNRPVTVNPVQTRKWFNFIPMGRGRRSGGRGGRRNFALRRW
jgi:hypothetical protein